MELTKQRIEQAKFRTRGRWYKAEEVDAFLEELTVAADEADRHLKEARMEAQALRGQVEILREENVQLWNQVKALQQMPPAGPDPAPARQPACRELKAERDQLIQDIKALRNFREAFRKAVRKDAGDLAEKAESLSSDKLL